MVTGETIISTAIPDAIPGNKKLIYVERETALNIVLGLLQAFYLVY